MSNVYCCGASVYSESLERILTIVAEQGKEEIIKQKKEEIIKQKKLPVPIKDIENTLKEISQWHIECIDVVEPFGLRVAYRGSSQGLHIYQIYSASLNSLAEKLILYVHNSTPKNSNKVKCEIDKFEKQLMKDEFHFHEKMIVREEFLCAV